MKSAQKTSVLWGTLSTAVLLASCGGGGSSSTTSSTTTTTPSTITSGSTTITSGSTSSVVPLSSTQIESLAKAANTADFMVYKADIILSYGDIYLNSPNLPALSGTNASIDSSNLTVCPNGGSYTATWNTASATNLTVGDTMTLILQNCGKSSTLTMNGTETYTITSIGASSYSLSGSFIGTAGNYTYNTMNLVYTVTPSTNTTITSGSVNATTSASSYTNITPGTYAISNVKVSTTITNSTDWSSFEEFTSSGGGFNNVTVKNQSPLVYTNNAISSYPTYTLGFSTASITVKPSASSSTLTGKNLDGFSINQILNFRLFS